MCVIPKNTMLSTPNTPRIGGINIGMETLPISAVMSPTGNICLCMKLYSIKGSAIQISQSVAARKSAATAPLP